MTELIKGLSSKLVKMKIEGKNVNTYVQEGVNKNINQFRRPFNLQQILQRDRRKPEDEKVQKQFI